MPTQRLLMIGFAHHVLFYFVKLMNTEYAFGILTICTGFLSKAGTEANEGLRQLFGLKDLVFIHTRDRNLRCANKKGIIASDPIDLVASFRKLHFADEGEITCH